MRRELNQETGMCEKYFISNQSAKLGDTPQKKGFFRHFCKKQEMAGVAGLEPVTSAVTGQRSNQLSYTPVLGDQKRSETF